MEFRDCGYSVRIVIFFPLIAKRAFGIKWRFPWDFATKTSTTRGDQLPLEILQSTV